jgi:uncharacterized protein YfaS (alpha-2-macroglobulin family)
MAAAARYRMALVDRLPAGLEVVEARLGGSDEEFRYRHWDHVEAHDDRVAVFGEWLPASGDRYEYLARATTAGSFTLPPATIEEMYRPAHMARTNLSHLDIQ